MWLLHHTHKLDTNAHFFGALTFFFASFSIKLQAVPNEQRYQTEIAQLLLLAVESEYDYHPSLNRVNLHDFILSIAGVQYHLDQIQFEIVTE